MIMIVVTVFRPEARIGEHDAWHIDEPLDGVEIFGVYEDREFVRLPEFLAKLVDANPGWKFDIDARASNRWTCTQHGEFDCLEEQMYNLMMNING
jgi:hypothetical protein